MKNKQLNRLEQFIFDHRAAFDMATPPDERIWSGIERALNAEQDSLELFIRQHRANFDVATPPERLWTTVEQQLSPVQLFDLLESFIADHRADFDVATPRFQVWTAVDKTLHPEQHRRWSGGAAVLKILHVAAAVLLLLFVGAIGGIYFSKSQWIGMQKVASLSDISPEYAEMVRYYNMQIDQKIRQVSIEHQDPSVLADLKAIDQTMRELEAELQRAPKGAEEQIISNLIRSYQIKVEILERVLSRIQQSKTNSKSAENEVSI